MFEELRKSKGERISFEEEFQRREAAFALASRLGQKTGLPAVGVRQLDTILASVDDGIEAFHTGQLAREFK